MGRHFRLNTPKFVVLAFVSAAAFAFGCGSDEDNCEISDPAVKGSSLNLDGVAYPTEDLGGRARSGSKAGQRIPNFSFSGYPKGDRSKGLTTISFADYFDPQAKRSKVLHLVVACAWCPVCQAETAQMSSDVEALEKEGLVAVEVLIEGKKRGRGTSLCDMDEWTSSRVKGFTVLMDVEAQRMGTIASIDAVPWNAMIDTRSMEILSIVEGSPKDYPSYVREGITWVNTHPAK